MTTAAIKRYWTKLAEHGCLLCGSPAEWNCRVCDPNGSGRCSRHKAEALDAVWDNARAALSPSTPKEPT